MNIKTRKYLFLATALLNFWNIRTQAQSNKDYSQMPILVKEAALKGDTALANSIAQDYINSYLFKQKENVLFTKDNLEFISQYIGNTKSKAFNLYQQKKQKVNAVLGENKAEYAIRPIIDLDYLPLYVTWKVTKPDWDAIEKKVTAKFGSIGQEEVQGKRMVYYQEQKDWINFGKYYILYFEKALKRPEYVINTLSWDVFLHVDDPKVLAFAIDIMKYSLAAYYAYNPGAVDTYANLLYKSGRIKEGVEWEEKAIKSFPGNKEFTDNLDKMKKGQQTW